MIYYIKHSETHKKLEINKQINLKKIMLFFKKNQKNHNMIIKTESAFSILIDSEIEKI